MIFAIIDPGVQSALIGAGGTLAGVLIASVFSYLNNRVARKVEDRRMRYDTASRIAIEQWREDIRASEELHPEGIGSPLEAKVRRAMRPDITETIRRIMANLETEPRKSSFWLRVFRRNDVPK